MAITAKQEKQLNAAIIDLETSIIEDIFNLHASREDIEAMLVLIKAKVNALTVDNFDVLLDE